VTSSLSTNFNPSYPIFISSPVEYLSCSSYPPNFNPLSSMVRSTIPPLTLAPTSPFSIFDLLFVNHIVLQHRQSHDFLPPLSRRLDHQVTLQGAAGETARASEGHYPASLP